MVLLNLETSSTIAHGFLLTAWKATQSIFLTSLLAFLFSLCSKGTRISKENQKKSLSALASVVACSFLKSC